MSSRADTNDYDALGRDVLAASSSGGGAGGKGAEVGEASSGVQRLLAAINLPVDTPRGARWGNLDPVYSHPETGAKVFVGNATAAKSKELLLEHNITRVVNCKDPDDPCWHKDDPDFEYLRFPIAYHWRVLGGKANDKQAILEYFGKLFDWTDKQLADGKSVLIHCLAGAHRAGTTGVSYVMHAGGLNMSDAIAICSRQRPVINPIGSFPDLLSRLNTALGRR